MTGYSTSVLVSCSCFGFRPSIPRKGGTAALYFSALAYCGQIVTHLSYCCSLKLSTVCESVIVRRHKLSSLRGLTPTNERLINLMSICRTDNWSYYFW